MIEYLRHAIWGRNLRKNPSKVKAVRDMEEPTEVTSLKRFLRMVKYL